MFQTGFVLGFLVAIALGVAIAGLLGSARLARVFGLLAGSRTAHRSTKRPAAAVSPVEADVIAALVNLKANGAAARQATADAAQYLRRYKAPETFESLFNAAVATLRSQGATV